MRESRTLTTMKLALAAVLGTALVSGVASAQMSMPEVPSQQWSFQGPFGTFDLAAAQRGFQVYKEVCSTCHSMNLVHYRDLTGIGLSTEQIKAVAASVDVPTLDDSGQPATRTGTPADVFKAPYPNVKAASAANGGAVPPDQSLIVNARENGPNYIYALLNGYVDPPAGFKLQDGLYYNKWFVGNQIHMPQPLHDEQVTYADGTKATIPQMAHDVVTFLAWTSNPEMVTRKQTGVRMVLFFLMMTGLTYAVKRKIWADVDH